MERLTAHWALKDAQRLNWQSQYTGHDPSLCLPEKFDNELAENFLLAFARFEDSITNLNSGPLESRPDLSLNNYLRELEKSSGSNTVSGTIKRASFNLNLLGYSRGGFVRNYVPDYISETVSDLKTLVFRGQVVTGKRQNRRARKALGLNKDESFESYTNRFIGYCRNHEDISARGFMDYLSTTKKVQYVEPWLLYIGQTLEELSETLQIHNGPEDLKAYVEQLQDAYTSSGLQNAVNHIRKLALHSSPASIDRCASTSPPTL